MKDRTITGDNGETLYVTSDGDMVDAIAHSYYGKHERNTEMLLEANPHVLPYGPMLPAGLVIMLPAVQAKTAPKPFRQLWD